MARAQWGPVVAGDRVPARSRPEKWKLGEILLRLKKYQRFSSTISGRKIFFVIENNHDRNFSKYENLEICIT